MRSKFAPIVTCLGLGLSPVAPGTVGSLGALAFWYIGRLRGLDPWAAIALTIVLGLIGTYAIYRYENESGREDSSEIVIDEWVGLGVGVWFLPLDWRYWVAAFVLFRLFDIGKPPGVRFFDERHMKGAGVMLDDVVAGFYTFLCLQAFLWLVG